MKKILEKDIQKDIRKWLKEQNIFHWKVSNSGIMPSGKRVTTLKGISDIIGILPDSGMLLAIEIKNEKGTASKEQTKFIENINNNGGVAFIARSVSDCEEALREHI